MIQKREKVYLKFILDCKKTEIRKKQDKFRSAVVRGGGGGGPIPAVVR